MSIFQSFRLALKSLWGNKLRSLLTMLGIIIGIAAVMVIVGLGNGMEQQMRESFASMGTNTLDVNIWGRGDNSTRTVTDDDFYNFANKNKNYFTSISAIYPFNGDYKIGGEELKATTVYGVGEDYDKVKELELKNGRFLKYMDIKNRSYVCVIGSYVNKKYFGRDAIGKEVKISGTTFVIVGVLDEKEGNQMGTLDDYVYIPYSTAMKMSKEKMIPEFQVALTNEDKAKEARKIIEKYLYDVFGTNDAFYVVSTSEMIKDMSKEIKITVTVLTTIAAISLVVGGIGIMNIMLVSVTERTREIGIRKALGAKRKHILRQFVIEATVSSSIGGIIGILLGYVLSFFATNLTETVLHEQITVFPSFKAVIIAFSISVGIGILFGYLPARKASRLNPIDALRNE